MKKKIFTKQLEKEFVIICIENFKIVNNKLSKMMADLENKTKQ